MRRDMRVSSPHRIHICLVERENTMVLAPSWSPIISITSFPPTIDIPALPRVPCFVPMPYESPMLKPSEWHAQKEAEQSARLEEEDPTHILIAHCELCDIGIGPGHIEQEMYLYFVHHESVLCIIHGREHLIKKEAIEELGGHWFLCCGGCARSKKRSLPQEQCLFNSTHWTTTALICQEGEAVQPLAPHDFPRLWQQKDAYLTSRLAAFGLPLSWFSKKLASEVKVEVPVQPAQAPSTRTTFASKGMALPHKVITHSLAS